MIAIAARGRSDVARTKREFGITYILVPGPQASILKSYDLYNEDKKTLAAPATFIVDKAGILRWKYVSTSDADRPSASRVLRELRKVDGAK